MSDDILAVLVARYFRHDWDRPSPILPWVDVATGSLGQGLAYGVGIALLRENLDRVPLRVRVLCGDSEPAEGSIWEALDKAGYQRGR